MNSTIAIFDYDGSGLSTFLRALHILAGICWIGLLYYFNVVQVPSFAAYGDEGRARNVSIDKLARRALWWFRWAAITTFVLGILIMGLTKDYMKDFMTAPAAGLSGDLGHDAAILVGMAAGTLMMLNVWGIIWRNQKVVLANAAAVLGGAEANPAAAGAGRAALLASRANFIFSFTMLWFMVGAAHVYGGFDVNSAGKAWVFVIIALVLGGIIELLALGLIGGKAATNKLLWPFESHKNAMITGFSLWLVIYLLSEILLKTSAFG